MRAAEMVRAIIRQRRYLGLTQAEVSSLAGMSEGHWHDMESGRRDNPHVETVRRMARGVGMELALIPPHAVPFLDLDPAEAYEVMRAIEHYRAGMKGTVPEVVATAANKIGRWTRKRDRRFAA